MGMYDDLIISTSKLPLTDEEKNSIGENIVFQTKDFDCILSKAEITEEGKLRFYNFNYKWDENVKSGLFSINGKLGGLITENERWENITNIDTVTFYTNSKIGWIEFNAKFENGNLISIERVL